MTLPLVQLYNRPMNIKNSLEKLKDFYNNYDRLPSLGEIADLFSYSSRNSAVYLVKKLIEHELIRKDPQTGKLLTTPLFHNRVKLLGSVAAGFPTAEEEELGGTISLEDYLIEKPTSTFMLEVKGDSMIDAGILPRDMVLVEKGRLEKNGDIVIAEVDGEWTMKYLRSKNGKKYLQAANPNYPDIHPEETLNIAGVVISTCRKYG